HFSLSSAALCRSAILVAHFQCLRERSRPPERQSGGSTENFHDRAEPLSPVCRSGTAPYLRPGFLPKFLHVDQERGCVPWELAIRGKPRAPENRVCAQAFADGSRTPPKYSHRCPRSFQRPFRAAGDPVQAGGGIAHP